MLVVGVPARGSTLVVRRQVGTAAGRFGVGTEVGAVCEALHDIVDGFPVIGGFSARGRRGCVGVARTSFLLRELNILVEEVF